MHISFSDWYRAAAIKLEPEELKRRWQIVEALGKKLELIEALELLRIADDLPQKKQSYQEDLTKRAQEIDPTFSARNNQLELSILSGAVLIQLLSDGSSLLGDQIGLAVVAATCRGFVVAKLPHQSDMGGAAQSYLASRAHEIRLTDESEFSGKSIEGIDQAVKTFIESVGWQNNPHQKSFESVINLLKMAFNIQSKQIERLEYELRLQREETNILWWLLGEHSRDFNCPISELDTGVAAIVMGKELADLINLRPGPRSAQGFLHRMLQKTAMYMNAEKPTEMVALRDVINAMPRDYRERWMGSLTAGTVIDLCPVHLAAKKSLEVTEKNLGPACSTLPRLSRQRENFHRLTWRCRFIWKHNWSQK